MRACLRACVHVAGCGAPVAAAALLTPRPSSPPCLPFPARYLSLHDAQAKALVVDWSDPANKPVKPAVLGTQVFSSYPIEEVLPYIDWNPFFQVRGRALAL